MKHLLKATNDAVANNNWYAALALALTLPDICGRLAYPGLGSKTRFVRWFGEFALERHSALFAIGPDDTMLSGEDCYALRCAFLHQGEFGIEDQRARELLECFHFTFPHVEHNIHMNLFDGSVLQMDIAMFCMAIHLVVTEWLQTEGDTDVIQERIAKLGVIY